METIASNGLLQTNYIINGYYQNLDPEPPPVIQKNIIFMTLPSMNLGEQKDMNDNHDFFNQEENFISNWEIIFTYLPPSIMLSKLSLADF